jgi:undecaprenyl-diphosphatase
MRSSLIRVLEWIGEREGGALVAVLMAAAGIWLFVALAAGVQDGDTHAFDEKLLLSLRSPTDTSDPIGPSWAEEMARDVTGLGSAGILGLITLAAAGFLFLQGKGHLAVYVLAAVVSGTVVSSLLKLGFARPRPELAAEHVVYTASFPSGHAMLSAVTFLTLGALLASAQSSKRMKAYLLGLAVLLTLMVGASRVYLGVHWPTDVVAGWAAGAAWALVCWTVARRLRQRGSVE